MNGELEPNPAIGLVSPGEMGAAVGRALAGAGHAVFWASEGRSSDSVRRAEHAALTDTGTLAELARICAVLLSIVPPHAALDTARSVGGFTGLYVDANAIAPATAGQVAATVEAGGATFVDGGIIGPPPERPGTTRLYLSGARAPAIAALFAASALEAVPLSGPVTDASAVKMTYAAWTKGTTALLLATHATAQALGIAGTLEREWERSQPGLPGRLSSAHAAAEHKGWRWVGEMEEIASTFEDAGAPGGFHRAAAEVFRQPREPPAWPRRGRVGRPARVPGAHPLPCSGPPSEGEDVEQ